MSYMIIRYPGLASYGRIYGTVFGVFSAGAALGPISMGWTYDNPGGYTPLLTVFASSKVVVIVLIATLGPYRWQASRAEPSRPGEASVAAAPVAPSGGN